MSPYNRDPHPAEKALLDFFASDHLPERLRAVSQPFADLAAHIVNSAPPSAETTMALRKLLEAKDCDRLLGDGRIRPLPAREDGLRLYETLHRPRGRRRRLPAHLRPLARAARRRAGGRR